MFIWRVESHEPMHAYVTDAAVQSRDAHALIAVVIVITS
jgi:hypothetical protein